MGYRKLRQRGRFRQPTVIIDLTGMVRQMGQQMRQDKINRLLRMKLQNFRRVRVPQLLISKGREGSRQLLIQHRQIFQKGFLFEIALPKLRFAIPNVRDAAELLYHVRFQITDQVLT